MNKNFVANTLVAGCLMIACATHRASNLSDGQVLGVNAAVSSAEIDKARVASTRANDERVRDYAEQVLTRHDEALNKDRQLRAQERIQPVGSIPEEAVTGRVVDTLDDLRDTDDRSFDAAYLDAQIEQQQKVANMIDAQLLPTTSNPELKERLMETRALVQKNLDDARALRASLTTASR